ncbi:MAG TPA: hypothetical protein VGM31_15255 [Puia sp.]
MKHAKDDRIMICRLLGRGDNTKKEKEKEKKETRIFPVILPDQRFPQYGAGLVHAIDAISTVCSRMHISLSIGRDDLDIPWCVVNKKLHPWWRWWRIISKSSSTLAASRVTSGSSSTIRDGAPRKASTRDNFLTIPSDQEPMEVVAR